MLGLPYLWNTTAYAAVTSIAVIGLYIAYVLPTLLRLLRGADSCRGPWHLGRWSRPIGIIAVVWVAFITILFMLPTGQPDHRTTFNYTVVAVLAVLGFARIYWFVSARNWFTGPEGPGHRRGTGRDRARTGVTGRVGEHGRRGNVQLRRISGRPTSRQISSAVAAGTRSTR